VWKIIKTGRKPERRVGLKPDFEKWSDSDRNAFGKFVMSIILLL
jgi:hypothetical protein